ncbi:hypothetical protein [Subtercola endophyticus]|uniref:hypothetical protein n=1 Tax=Subtercola endophyticus TaxID=2895559 RepID=UPI001E28457F|nr:hypothetical protein [Subtercola endophyticus]UFS58695.1 hypothetical protein LQ955_17120 [Subtercola endophyticus]
MAGTLLAALLGFLQVANTFTPDNAKLFLGYAVIFGALCAPLGLLSGLVAGIFAGLVFTRVRPLRRSYREFVVVSGSLIVGNVPGLIAAIWLSGIFALETKSPSGLLTVELIFATMSLAVGGAVWVRRNETSLNKS